MAGPARRDRRRLTRIGADSGCLNARALRPFWRAAEALGASVAVFAPDQLNVLPAILERHPTLRLVVDHLGVGVYPGWPDPFGGFPLLRAPFEQVVAKISGLVETSTEPFPFRDVHRRLEQALEWARPVAPDVGLELSGRALHVRVRGVAALPGPLHVPGRRGPACAAVGTFAAHDGWTG